MRYPKLEPRIYEDTKKPYWCLLEDFSVMVEDSIYTVKAEFDFDGASIPRAFRSLVGDKMSFDIVVAALFHDCLYCNHLLTRSESDDLFRTLMKMYGASWLKRTVCWSAVRTFGGFCWNKSDEEIEKYTKFMTIIKGVSKWLRKLK